MNSWKRLILIGFLLFMLAGCRAGNEFCDQVNEIPKAECRALLALYHSTDGPNWLDHRGWNDTHEPCKWYGVKCTNGHITSITLNVNDMTGTLPPELGDLSQLEVFVAYYNFMYGSLPPELGNTSLRVLILHNNKFDGTIPSSFGQLVNATKIDLENNDLEGPIPPELGQLENLQMLNLRGNKLSGSIPPELGQLSKLEGLLLSNNPLSGEVPQGLTGLTNLRMFSVAQTDVQRPLPGDLEELVESGLDWFSEGIKKDDE